MSHRQHADVSPNRDDDLDLEKEEVIHTEQVHNGNMTAEEVAFLANFSEDQRKAVVRKVDWRLVPMLLVLYLISFIDRANIGERRSLPCLRDLADRLSVGNAKIEGLLPDLNMSGTQYNIALAIFFIPYTLAGAFNRRSKRLGCVEADANCRGTQQCDSQSVRSTIVVYGRDCHGLGHRDDLPWICEELPGALWCPCIARIVRVSSCYGMGRWADANTTGQGRFLPRCYFAHLKVVSSR
jgi:hypothetical protein